MIPASHPATPLTAERSPWLRGPIRLPGDPALAAYALILAAMARGESVLENLPAGPATAAVAAALGQMGINISVQAGRWHVQGIGTGGLLLPAGPLDVSAMGPIAGLFVALLAAGDSPSDLAGVPEEVAPLLAFLERNGVAVERDGQMLRLRGPRFGIPLDLGLSAGAATLLPPLLLQALVTAGRSTLHLPRGAHDPVIDVMAVFGARLAVESEGEGERLVLEGLSSLRAQALAIPGDASLAAYPAVAALIAPDSDVTISGVALHPHGLALLDALALMGADIRIGEVRRGGAEVAVRHCRLHGATIPADLGIAPDDYPVLAVAAAFAEGETSFDGLGEGTRRFALTRALRANGIDCGEKPGGLVVRGQGRAPGGGIVSTRLDPRLAMAFLVLGMGADQPVTIDDGAAMADLFPGFVAAFEHIGAGFSVGSPA